MNIQYNLLTQCNVEFLHWVKQVILKLFCLKPGPYSFTKFLYYNSKDLWLAPLLQVKVSLVNSAGGSFCWNKATDTFYSNYAGANVCCSYAGGTFRYNCVGGFFCCSYVDDCFCCNYAVRNFSSIYAGKSFCIKYVGDNFYWNCAHGSLLQSCR